MSFGEYSLARGVFFAELKFWRANKRVDAGGKPIESLVEFKYMYQPRVDRMSSGAGSVFKFYPAFLPPPIGSGIVGQHFSRDTTNQGTARNS